ncbi:MAG: beta-galactosidase [Propionibacteriaceae bacterium]|nr:beta-galactosidase [Propionibacteriaceae bacterium]
MGSAYDAEYVMSERIDDDMRLMHEAGFSVIRVTEPAWSRWELEDGQFTLDWLQPIVDASLAQGMGTILSLPTPEPPPWLARKHPEIAARRHQGEPWGRGTQPVTDVTHQGFRVHAERMIRQVVGRYRDHRGVIGFQVDNVPSAEIFRSPGIFDAFVESLRQQYTDVDAINRDWGLVSWSRPLSTWNDLWAPDSNTVPQYDMAWKRFQSRVISDFVSWQSRIIREVARPDQFVTTCVPYGHPAGDDPAVASQVDITSGRVMFDLRDGLSLSGSATPRSEGVHAGPWGVALAADRAYSSRQEPFLVTQTASLTGSPIMNAPCFDGQWRQVAWSMIARGARMLEFRHWHALTWDRETYWTSVLPHDTLPGRVFEQLSGVGVELQALGSVVSGLIPDAQIGLLWSNPSSWAVDFQPAAGRTGEESSPGEGVYDKIVGSFYRGAFETGVPVRILHDSQLGDGGTDLLVPAEIVETLPVLVVAGLYVADDHLIDWLRRYVEAGGHLVVGPHTAVADSQARVRGKAKPAGLTDVLCASYQEMASLEAPITVESSAPGFPVPPGAQGTIWLEGLYAEPEAQVLATYVHPHYGRYAAVVTHRVGHGRATIVGTVPDPALAKALVQWLVPPTDPWRTLVAGPVTITSATLGDGRKLRVVYNWSWVPVVIQLPQPARDVTVPDTLLPSGHEVALNPWDVRAFVQ